MEKIVLFAELSVPVVPGIVIGRNQDFDRFRLFRDSSRGFGERVDKGAAFFVDPELDSPGRCAHDV